MQRAHVIRLNPTPEQEVSFRKGCGVARHAYNWALARWKEQYGGYVQLVDRWYPSSKTCSCCGWVNEHLKLSDRVFICEECGVSLDRDLNASLNIRKEALRLISDVPVVASSGHKFAGGAGSSGPFGGETFCNEASTKVL